MRAEQKAAAAEHSAAPPAVRALLLRPRGVRGDRPGPARSSALSEQPARRPNPPLSRAGLVPAALPARSAGASLAVLACLEGGGSLGAGSEAGPPAGPLQRRRPPPFYPSSGLGSGGVLLGFAFLHLAFFPLPVLSGGHLTASRVQCRPRSALMEGQQPLARPTVPLPCAHLARLACCGDTSTPMFAMTQFTVAELRSQPG